ncbi:MAG: SGNH/GDSL hydrolase family protein [Armatimonadota bacterium]
MFHGYPLILALAVMKAGTPGTQVVVPMEKPSMMVQINTGKYTILGKKVIVPSSTVLAVDPPEKISIANEEQVLEAKPEPYYAYIGGTTLKKTLGPIDPTRLPDMIVPLSVVLHSEPDGGLVYIKDVDYKLDDTWGGLWWIEGSKIPSGAKVYVDYQVYQQRIDQVQLVNGKVSIHKGQSSAICPEIPVPAKGAVPLANIHVRFRLDSVTSADIFPLPVKNLKWQDFIKVSGKEHLTNTISMLKTGKKVNIVCWGDSVTSGGSASPYDKCYVELFRKKIKEVYPKADITLTNAGIGGSNTESRKAGFEVEVLALNPDLITVEFVNDVGLGADWIKKNWVEFIAKARAKNPKVEFICLTPHFMKQSWMTGFDTSVQAMRDATVANKVALGDTTNIWAHLKDLGIPYQTLEANEINHPNNLGHEFFVETLMKLMK